MELSILDRTGDGRGIGGDAKHARLLTEALFGRTADVDVIEVGRSLDFAHRGWLLLPDVFARDDETVGFAEAWPGQVCQQLLVREEVYGRKLVDRARTKRLLDRADAIVQTGPHTTRAAFTLPYVPWHPEPELEVLQLTWSRPNALLVTGTLRASKGQRELALAVLRGETAAKHLSLMGNSQMWFSAQLREKLLAIGGASETEFASERWLRRDGTPRKSPREKPWRVTVGDRSVRYFGKYAGTSELAELLISETKRGWRYRHVNPTSAAWSPGHLEYSTLEAIAAGMQVDVPAHVPVRELYPEGLGCSNIAARHDPARVAGELVKWLT